MRSAAYLPAVDQDRLGPVPVSRTIAGNIIASSPTATLLLLRSRPGFSALGRNRAELIG